MLGSFEAQLPTRGGPCALVRRQSLPHPGWDLTVGGLSVVALVTSYARRGLTEAMGATLLGATWQRCRTHHAAGLMAVAPKSAWGWVRALLHSAWLRGSGP
jgi:hypothetical protein